MRKVLPSADMLVSQGGVGVSSQCALAGVRHVILPTQMEQTLLARRLSEMGLAYAMNAVADEGAYLALFKQALACPRLAANCLMLARQYQGFSQSEQITAMVDEMMELLLPGWE
jgi:UDP:flavonoid glycosyltransferase YjiC (YdhE family)